MPKYLMFISHNEDYRNKKIPPALNDAMGKFVQDSFKNGSLVDTGGLLPTDRGKRITLRKGKLGVIDGPFAESKEVIGGWAIVKAKDMKEAMKVATEFMELHRVHWPEFEGTSEIREMEDFDNPAKTG